MNAAARGLLIVDGAFEREAEALRGTFDERFADPRSTRGDRFVWDWWHVPGQYTALRTPAWTYFPKAAYRRLHQGLALWGRRTLGCHDVSPPWLSCYVDGCRQELHGDLPHGPFAFVLSLTRWRGRSFRGGETLLVREEVLDYWSDFVSARSVEEPDVLRAVEPRFGRLAVFDPRVPHGVREVRGTVDPREGRLVLHGWFVQPRPFVEGPLPRRAVGLCIDAFVAELPRLLGGLPVAGVLSIGLRVAPSGSVRASLLADTTRVPRADERGRRAFVRGALAFLSRWRFPNLPRASHVTLPIVLERA